MLLTDQGAILNPLAHAQRPDFGGLGLTPQSPNTYKYRKPLALAEAVPQVFPRCLDSVLYCQSGFLSVLHVVPASGGSFHCSLR